MILTCGTCGHLFSGDARCHFCSACGEDCGDQVELHADEQWGHDTSDLDERLLADTDPNWSYRPQ